MLKRLKHHINLKIQKLLEKMIIATVIFLVVGFGLIGLYAFTYNPTYLSLLWILGLTYGTIYFIDAYKFRGIVNKLDEDSLTNKIYISKAYFDN